jgi:uncharacterized protein YukE
MPEDDAEDTASQSATSTRDDTAAFFEGWRWCEQALDAIRIVQLTSTSELLADSYQALQEKSYDLKRLATVREVLDRLASVQDRAEPQWRGIARKLYSKKMKARIDVAEQYNDRAIKRISLAHHDKEELKRSKAFFQLIHSAAQLDRRVWEVQDKRYATRKSARRFRRIVSVAHQLMLALVGVLLGVVAVQLVQDRIESTIHLIAAWAFAVVAWAVLDYLLEPRLRAVLARRSLKLLKKELSATFEAWRMLRKFQEENRSELKNLDDRSEPELLPDWSTFTNEITVSG